MRHKPTQQEVARRAPSTIAAVLHALKTGLGSRKVVKSYPRVKGAPDAVQTEVQNHLLKLKKSIHQINHRFLTDPGTDQPRTATQATLPKGAKVYYPSGGRGKRRKLDNGVRRR